MQVKKSILAILLLSFFFSRSSAQYCGSPDTISCNASAVSDTPGLYPSPVDFSPVLNNFLTNTTIYFRNFDTIFFGTEVLPVYSLKWDTIQNLPPGLCWSTNKTNNTFNRGEAGCIHIRGLACGSTGQYKLSTLVTVDIGIPVETDGDPGGLKYFVRLENPGDAFVEVDTTQKDSVPFIPYGGGCQNLTPLVVSLGADQTVCAGSIVTFSPQVSGGQAPYTYFWQYSGSSITCPNCEKASSTVNQNSTFILKVTDASGAYGFDTINYTVSGSAFNFAISATQPTTFCGGGTSTITTNALTGLTYQWYNGSQAITGETGPSLNVTDSTGSYYLLYNEGGVCQATSNVINLTFFDTAIVTINSIGSDTFCVGGAVSLVANAVGEGLSYNWLLNDSSLGNTSSAITLSNEGFVQVAVTNLAGCTDTSAGVLIVASPNFPPFVSYNQFADDTLCNNAQAITLNGGQPAGGYYSGYGVTDTIFNPANSHAGLNLVYYTYTDNTGCGNSVYDSVYILICTGISETVVDGLVLLYPNPALDEVIIESEQFGEPTCNVLLYDVAGRVINTNCKLNTSKSKTFDIHNLSAGCYWFAITFNGNRVCKQFIKL